MAKRRIQYQRSTDPNQGQLAWTLFVGFVVAICALLQVSFPRTSSSHAPLISATPVDHGSTSENPIHSGRLPASDFN